MISFKALAAAVLLTATAAAPAFARTPVNALVPGGVSSSDHALYAKNLRTPAMIRGTTSIRTGP